MDQKAVDMFKQDKKFSLDVNAGVAIVGYARSTQASGGAGDIVLWTDASGAYAGASVSEIAQDREDDRKFYGDNADLTKILAEPGRFAKAKPLRDALPG